MASDNTDDLKKYAATLVTDCVLTDGYVCESVIEDDFLSESSQARLVPAVYLPAWGAAYKAFNSLEDLSVDEKNLKHYRIGFTESGNDYIILFAALLLPARIVNTAPEGVSTISFGRSMKFWINKKSLNVTKHLYYD